MSISSPSYLYQNQYGYYFRLRIPVDLQGSFGKTELRYSLRSSALSDAKYKARLLAGRVQKLMRTLRNNTMPQLKISDIQTLVASYAKESLASDEEQRATGKPRTPDAIDHQLDAITDIVSNHREALALNKTHRLVTQDADLLLKHSGFTTSKNSDEYKLLCREIAKANINILNVIKNRELGNYDDESPSMMVPTTPSPAPMPNPVEDDSEPLQKVIDDFMSEKQNKVSKRTVEKSLGYLQAFTYFFGEDLPIATIDYKKMRDYKEFLKKLPVGFTKGKRFKGWSAQDVLNNTDTNIETLSDKTINHYLGEIITFFNYAVRHGYMDKNFAEGLKIPLSKAPHEQRDVFTQDELNKIFKSPEYENNSHQHPYQYWLPILALYTGARLEELCQLHVADIKQVDGIWCLDITTEGGTKQNPKRLKNKSSDRVVPLHSFLIDDLKFLEYVETVKSSGAIRLFHEIHFSISEDKWGAIPSKWFKRYKTKCGIKAPPRQKDWHAFRHTVVDNLAQQLIPEAAIKSLVGHSKEGETLGRYAKNLNVRKVYEEAVLKLEFGLDLEHLKGSKWVSGSS